MSISGISSHSYTFPQVTQTSGTRGTTQTGSAGGDSDGDNDASAVSGAGAAGGPGGFLGAVFQALSQAGVTGAAPATASGATSQNPLQALGAFLHDLFAAMQTPGGSTSGNAPVGNSAASGVAQGKGGGLAALEANLQNLIQQITASASSAGSTAGSIGSTSSTSSTSATAQLQQDYQNLLNSMGATAGSSTLGGFLQALSQNLQGMSHTGNVVNTQA